MITVMMSDSGDDEGHAESVKKACVTGGTKSDTEESKRRRNIASQRMA